MKQIAVVGLGYVGLPLAIEFGKKRDVVGFDINSHRISELRNGLDRTNEASKEDLQNANKLTFSDNLEDLRDSQIYIITVPTPINDYKQPDLKPLLGATRMIGGLLKKGDIVIYESTVYPGCTEEDCVPILESESNLTFNSDFFCAYSPERINPGDKIHRLQNIVKVVSGSNNLVADEVQALYDEIIEAGTHKVSSIKVAEASKVIENSQRDLNIAFVNELALIFNKMGIDTNEVLEAAGTKWNFLKFQPGLVGGHCIGVDPYYLTHRAESLGYHPQVILAGRRINDNMGKYIANEIIKLLVHKNNQIKGARVLIMGFTFKENCPDIRNTRIIDVYKELKSFHIDVEVYDPHADLKEVFDEYGVNLIEEPNDTYHGIVMAVSHQEFVEMDISQYINDKTAVYDVKSILETQLVDKRL